MKPQSVRRFVATGALLAMAALASLSCAESEKLSRQAHPAKDSGRKDSPIHAETFSVPPGAPGAGGSVAARTAASGAALMMGAPPGESPYRISVGGTDPVNGQAFDAMFFEHYGVNPFIDTEDDRFATFAVDVDNASYTMTRAYLDRGELPPKEAIRVEEFVNAFRHAYPAPRPADVASAAPAATRPATFGIHLDAAPSPFGNGLTLLRVGIKGREIAARDRKPAVLTFVVDVSGSMGMENRLGLVKRALKLLLDQMTPEDQVALVVYGTDSRTILSHTSLRERERIAEAIESLETEGATNAEAGLLEAYRLADRGFDGRSLNRVILCSDGVANVGNTGAEAILERIKSEARRGIELTTVGFGMGNYNDVLMEKLADQGDGNYYYVDDLNEARRVFVENLTGTLQTIARQTKIQVEFDPQTVRRYRLLGYENRDVADRDFRNDAVDAGEVGAGHEVTALFEMKLAPGGAAGEAGSAGRGAGRNDHLATVRIRYEDPESRQVTEESRELSRGDLKARISDCPPSFAIDAAAAEFAEVLRHSYWAREGSLAAVAEFTRTALASQDNGPMGNSAEVQELLRLVDTADRLWPKTTSSGWRDDDGQKVRPKWEPEGE